MDDLWVSVFIWRWLWRNTSKCLEWIKLWNSHKMFIMKNYRFFCVEICFGWHFRLLSHFVSHSHEIWIGMRCYITLVGFLWSPWSNIWSLPSNVVDFWWNIDEFTCKLQRWNFYRTIIVKYDLNENHLEVHFCLYLKKIGLDVTEMDAMHFNLQLKKTTTKSESCIL